MSYVLCTFSIEYFRCYIKWTQYAFYDDTGFQMRNHRISMRKSIEALRTTYTQHLHIFAYSAVHWISFVFEIDFSPFPLVNVQLHTVVLCNFDQVKCSKLHNLQPKLLKQSCSIYTK